MKQGIYRILKNEEAAPGIYRMLLQGDTSAFLRGGQFVDIAVGGCFLRRPIAVREWNDDSLWKSNTVHIYRNTILAESLIYIWKIRSLGG